MEQEIWHDDLYATREKPVKPRQCKHKSCVKFASSEKMVVDAFTNTDKKELGSKLEKAMQLERLLDYESDVFGNNAMHVAELYNQAGNECKSQKLKDFCDTRRKLNANKATIWRRENNAQNNTTRMLQTALHANYAHDISAMQQRCRQANAIT